MADTIYHLASAADWEAAQSDGVYRGGPVDRADGFIHFSGADHVAESAARYLAGRNDLVLLAVDPAQLTADLKWQPGRDGIRFPHLFGPLDLSAVRSATPIAMDATGDHLFPPHIPPRKLAR